VDFVTVEVAGIGVVHHPVEVALEAEEEDALVVVAATS
jgi:hypothetical protein